MPFFDCITVLFCCLVGLTFSYDGIKEKDIFRVDHCCVVLAYIVKKMLSAKVEMRMGLY